ncbi:hypothetical protein [Phaeodactylibacter sp.]|uniref:hypothetical protein n=1 Tax=Phaeodactylibacter sp. TaxID=1940289 RepID=UPI0025DA7BC9|nr:hypothetical protein [Phaeodactylibacter sp.]MCI4647573.1 hypothetical protein [Phaeodactylibacter sp.]MCI5090808.1 hypothetical protein [Phaeodactylibacter sp.]
MVQKLPNAPPQGERKRKQRRILAAIVGICLLGAVFSLPGFIEIDENGNYRLSAQRKREYQEKSARSERVEVYRLIATRTGLYNCLRCPGITKIKLQSGEVWKYGITRKGKGRYSSSFYASNYLMYEIIAVTDILKAEQLERKLIIAYPLLPEAQARMARYGIFLKRPPGNTKDM